MLGHFAVSCADFYPAIRWIHGRRRLQVRVRRNTDGARDLFAPVGIRKKMLAKSLTSHAPKVYQEARPAVPAERFCLDAAKWVQ